MRDSTGDVPIGRPPVTRESAVMVCGGWGDVYGVTVRWGGEAIVALPYILCHKALSPYYMT